MNNNDRASSGTAYVVFGKDDTGTVELADLGSGGFRIGNRRDGNFASDVGSAGDVNGDGKLDLLIGSPYANHHHRHHSGSVYVIYGRSGARDVDAGTLGKWGFRIDGEHGTTACDNCLGDFLGMGLSSLGDADGDGRSELLISARYASTYRHGEIAEYEVGGRSTSSGASPEDVADPSHSTLAGMGFQDSVYTYRAVSPGGDQMQLTQQYINDRAPATHEPTGCRSFGSPSCLGAWDLSRLDSANRPGFHRDSGLPGAVQTSAVVFSQHTPTQS